jgi:hypothetical protein
MKMLSGVVRIILGLGVLGFGYHSYAKFGAKLSESEQAVVAIGTTGIKLTRGKFMLLLLVVGLIGVALIVLGIRSLAAKPQGNEARR